MPIERPIIPAQIFRPGTQNPKNRVGYGDKVAIIGDFPCVSKKVERVNSYYEAVQNLNITPRINDKYHEDNPERDENNLDPTKDYFNGARALKRIFWEGSGENNVSEAIIINTSTKGDCIPAPGSTSEDPLNGTLQFGSSDKDIESKAGEKNLTKLDYALERLKEEDYNILFLAWTPTPEEVDKLINFCKSEFRRSNPIGMIFGYGDKPLPFIDGDDTHGKSIVETVVNSTKSQTIEHIDQILALCKKFQDATYEDNHHHTLYGLIAQSIKLTYEDDFLAPLEAAAHYCGALAGTRVNYSMTDEIIPYVENINEELVYERNSVRDNNATDGYRLVQAGVTMFKKINRNTNDIVCINSTLPGKLKRTYDISHIRTAAYVIRKMQLREFFGDHENVITYDSILTKLTNLKDSLLGTFSNVLADIDYTLQTHDNNCIDVFCKIYCYDVLLQEEIYVDEVILSWQI